VGEDSLNAETFHPCGCVMSAPDLVMTRISSIGNGRLSGIAPSVEESSWTVPLTSETNEYSSRKETHTKSFIQAIPIGVSGRR
jgi:hypothetical protein